MVSAGDARDDALRSALERLPLAVLVLEGGCVLRPYNRSGAALLAEENLSGDLLTARPDHPLSSFLTNILGSCDRPASATITFPSGSSWRIEPSRRSEKGRERWIILLLERVEEDDPLREWGLTARERDVAMLLFDGVGSEAIADRLSISVETLKSHIRSLLAKSGTKTRAEFVAKALRRK